MTDKVQKIREEVERLKEWQPIASPSLNKLLSFIDSLQEEPVSERFAFKAIPRLLEMIEPTDRAKSYVAKLADAFDSEGYYTDAKIVRESLKIMNGEKVAMAIMDEEPVSEKKCMFSKDNYTDEDRKVLCEGCEAECKYSKQSVDEAMAEIEEKANIIRFAKEPDIDAIVEDFKRGIVLSQNLKSEDLYIRIIAYRKGLEDMYKLLKEK